MIGLSGYARAGKDEFARVLVEEFNFTRVSFGDKLRAFLRAQDPIVGNTGSPVIVPNIPYFEVLTPSNTKNWLEFPATNCNVRLSDVLRRVGWEGYKETQYYWEIRHQLQRLGTEAGRGVLGENTWVDATLGDLEDGLYVIPDVRFPNEARAIEDEGGVVIRVKNPRIVPVNDHPSETALDDWDFHAAIENNSTLKDYREAVRDLMYLSMV